MYSGHYHLGMWVVEVLVQSILWEILDKSEGGYSSQDTKKALSIKMGKFQNCFKPV